MGIFVAMHKLTDKTMVKAAVLGTLVADAAGMGLHWIYSQGKIAQVVKAHNDTAEFLDPDPNAYEGVPAFFAHPTRRAGDSSNYGEYLYVILKAVSDEGFDPGAYIRSFQEHFGVGGEYVGYGDGPMRETIYNIARIGKEIHDAVVAADVTLDDARRRDAAHYISRYFFEYDTEGLKRQVRIPLKLKQWSREELDMADQLVEQVTTTVGTIGADDDQMPALAYSPVLAFFYEGDELSTMVERAVRVTNNNDGAVAYAHFLARLMRDLYTGKQQKPADIPATIRALTERHQGVLCDSSQDLVRRALQYEKLDYRKATKTFGAACHVDMAVPLVLHILQHTGSFSEAVRINTLASGDNCGRAMMLGPLAGALYGIGEQYGIPKQWIDKTRMVRRVADTEGGTFLLA
jgi:ADP-ribosylglycohydrolase